MILSFLLPLIHKASSLEDKFNFATIYFKKEVVHANQNFPEVKIKRPILDHYLSGISSITSYYSIITIEILTPHPSNQPPHRMQTDDIK